MATPPAAPTGPRRWYTPAPDAQQRSDLMAPPFAPDTDEEQEKRRASQLFPQATWERPVDPTRTIYSSQLLHGLLEQAVVTGESSTVRIRMTETLYDKFGQQVPLLPVDTILLGTVEGGVKFGQTRVGIGLTKAELPDGTDLLLQGKAGDAAGAVGIRGKVDNKYGHVALAAILTAALSVGSRSAVGTPSGFYENPAQEFGRDVTQSLNQSGQDLVRRSLQVHPEISLPVHTPVTVQLSQNVSLQTAPIIIHK
jgi:type IV secretion system protein VirB10